ncbi:RNA polymerase II transcription factor B subunit 3 [Fulvia fulva]|uniref:RNA polymerase II transcription factor B subunit 3 n=1 Tax=Passalora fulva TaxID=5499 RepID=A0A9Q8L7H5_PASFU|nr:RNA polymerase II transcription factor B subunit 3 [Fulvia fulva]KAK4637231.1 RNA polymerase II transcription factor B subunit 3 [Fulvia fulva]UJO11603.1 RNA polymerase II transcription factor B subunit 3 [Fulvia fulva]
MRLASTNTPTDTPPPAEVCPVCKSTTYMKRNMRFLVNPACYHKMCESCVDRIFSHGPAQCPIKGCSETLRKNRFRQQTFEDIKVEREVDIRKKVAAVFNRREDEFESLRAYNDYLNEVEDITFNLINNIDLEDTERRFRAYEDQHKSEIAENASLAQQESMSYSALQKAEREQAKQRREATRREEAEEKREAAANKKDMLRRLESGQDPEQIAREGQGVALKKRMNRQAAAERQAALQAADTRNGSSSLVIKGLKAKTKAAPEAPLDPFGGLSFEHRYYAVQDEYVWDVLRDARKEAVIGAGGYDVSSFTSRALCEAFSGLGVMIADEKTERDRITQHTAVDTFKAELAAKDVKMEEAP